MRRNIYSLYIFSGSFCGTNDNPTQCLEIGLIEKSAYVSCVASMALFNLSVSLPHRRKAAFDCDRIVMFPS